MGFFDALTNLTPDQNAGLLGFASTLLSSSSDPRRPTDFGAAIQGGIQGAAQSRQRKLEEEQAQQLAAMRAQQMEAGAFDLQSQRSAAAKQAAIQKAAQDAMQGGQFDAGAFINSVRAIDPIQAAQFEQQLAKGQPEYDTTPTTVNGPDGKPVLVQFSKTAAPRVVEGFQPREKVENINGQWVNPYAQQDGGIAPQDPNKPFAMGPNGRPVANSAYQNYEISKARAGASNVSVNTATKPFLSEIGKGAGEAVNAAYQGAVAATKTLQNVDQIRQGLGGAILGPGANARVSLAQLGQTLGIAGKDTAEQLQNTRMVVQGLARQELSAAEAMKGQGQITESERGILRRAEAGQINDFTAPEVKTLLNALEKSARYRIGVHQSNMQRLQRDPNAQGVVEYMQVDAPPPTNTTQVAAPQAAKRATLADIAETARKSGRSTAEVTKALRDRGYTIEGGR
jgi:hypothetical protein